MAVKSAGQINKGMFIGLIGVIIFSLTLPFTKLIIPFFDPIFIGFGRSVIAAIVAVLILVTFKQSFPTKMQASQLLLTAAGIIAGFPVLSAYGMQTVPASHGSVVIGLLPLLTAVMAVIISKERPSFGFWVAATVGAALVIIYSLLDGGMEFQLGDVYLVGASILGAWGYAMGSKVSKDMGGWQVICWVNVVGLPLSLFGVLWSMPDDFLVVPSFAWAGLIYLALASQLIGFFFWYKGLVLGGVARVSQTQLSQPFFTIIASIFILGEQIDWITYYFAVAVVVAIAITRKMQIKTNE